MDPKALINALRRRPFVPFRLTLTEGSAYEVRHPEFCTIGKRSAIVGLAPVGDDGQLFEQSVTLDLLHIVELEPLENPAPPSAKGNGKQ